MVNTFRYHNDFIVNISIFQTFNRNAWIYSSISNASACQKSEQITQILYNIRICLFAVSALTYKKLCMCCVRVRTHTHIHTYICVQFAGTVPMYKILFASAVLMHKTICRYCTYIQKEISRYYIYMIYVKELSVLLYDCITILKKV